MQGDEMKRDAIVVGAGIAGLSAAAVLAKHFPRVRVLERDTLGDVGTPRPGVPQGKHYHGLLDGGLQALEELLPGFTDALTGAGALVIRGGLDIWIERSDGTMPKRDLGMRTCSVTRPTLERVLRSCVRALPNVVFEEGVNVRALRHGDRTVTGVELVGGGLREAAFVVDASGRGELTSAALTAMGYALPRLDSVGVEVRYTTAMVALPESVRPEFKGVITSHDPGAPRRRSGILGQMEHGLWTVMLAGRGQDFAPADPAGFLAYARTLGTSTIYDAVRDARFVVPPERFLFPESQQRHFEELTDFPAGLLPVGDALCRFNPAYGQGMSVAAIEMVELAKLLDAPHAPGTLALSFFEKAAEVIAGPWRMSVVPDLALPDTRGERPPDLQVTLRFGAVLTELAVRDPEVHRLIHAVANLLTPVSALNDPALIMRVLALEQELVTTDPQRWARPSA